MANVIANINRPSLVIAHNKTLAAQLYGEFKAFLHSHSYTGNPLACAAANATLDIFEHESILENNQEKIAFMASYLERFKNAPNVKSIRQTGMIAAVELKEYPIDFRVNLKVFTYALKQGVLQFLIRRDLLVAAVPVPLG